MTTTTVYLDDSGRHAGTTPDCPHCGEQRRQGYSPDELRDLLDRRARDAAARLAALGDADDLEDAVRDLGLGATTRDTMDDATLYVEVRDGRPVSVVGYVHLVDPDTAATIVEVETPTYDL